MKIFLITLFIVTMLMLWGSYLFIKWVGLTTPRQTYDDIPTVQTTHEIYELKYLLKVYRLYGEDITQKQYNRLCYLIGLTKYNRNLNEGNKRM